MFEPNIYHQLVIRRSEGIVIFRSNDQFGVNKASVTPLYKSVLYLCLKVYYTFDEEYTTPLMKSV